MDSETNKSKTFIALSIILLPIVVFSVFFFFLYNPDALLKSKTPLYSGSQVKIIPSSKIKDYKIIYFATKFHRHPLIDTPTAKTFVSPCPSHPKCVITSFDGYDDTAHATIVHWKDLERLLTPISLKKKERRTRTSKTLKRLKKSKLRIIANWESIPYTSRLEGIYSFHLVASYRRDSDIYVPFGKVVPVSTPTTDYEVVSKSNSSLQHLSTDFSFNKTLPAAWIASNCRRPCKRENYIKELQNHIRVDIYGKCGSDSGELNDPDHDCISNLSKEYYFYLAFENSSSTDYLTEKLFSSDKHTMIPIVYSDANYTDLFPPGSFIDARKYTPKQLAMLMNELIQDKRKYNRYFEWKNNYVMQTSNPLESLFCEVCKLFEPSKKFYFSWGKKAKKVIIDSLFNYSALNLTLKSGEDINKWFFGDYY